MGDRLPTTASLYVGFRALLGAWELAWVGIPSVPRVESGAAESAVARAVARLRVRIE